jgi:hypothetical protein
VPLPDNPAKPIAQRIPIKSGLYVISN